MYFLYYLNKAWVQNLTEPFVAVTQTNIVIPSNKQTHLVVSRRCKLQIIFILELEKNNKQLTLKGIFYDINITYFI